MSFKVKLSAYFLLLTLIPLAAAFGAFGVVLSRGATRTVDAELQSGLRAASARYLEEIAWSDQLAQDLAKNDVVRKGLEQGDLEVLDAPVGLKLAVELDGLVEDLESAILPPAYHVAPADEKACISHGILL